jgi:hypothetical protein
MRSSLTEVHMTTASKSLRAALTILLPAAAFGLSACDQNTPAPATNAAPAAAVAPAITGGSNESVEDARARGHQEGMEMEREAHARGMAAEAEAHKNGMAMAPDKDMKDDAMPPAAKDPPMKSMGHM